MSIIDADTHIDESESTWAKLVGTEYEKYIPVTVNMPSEVNQHAGYRGLDTRMWLVENHMQNRAIRDEINHPLRVYRELEDVPGRIAHMDQMGVEVQVIFPTFFIRYTTENAEAEWALTTTYNRWLAEKCSKTDGRLRWAAMLPFMRPEAAAEELRWAKDNGACGFFKRGFDLNRTVVDPHFFPVYEEASALDLPMCIHTGHPINDDEWDRGFPIMHSFTEIVTSNLPERFPNLRFGFIEAGASWIPYMVSQVGARTRQAERGQEKVLPELYDLAPDLFQKNRAFITIDLIDDVANILKFGTEDNLMIGTDYSHTDISANLDAFQGVQEWVNDGRITDSQARKLLIDNAKGFYGI